MAKKAKKTVKKNGRPTKYKAEYCQSVINYIETCKYVEGEERVLPSRVGLAIALSVDVDTLGNWGKKYPMFFGALKKVDDAQHQDLINRGMNGTGNSTITQLMLKNNHGYKDKQELGISGNINVIIDK